MTNLLGAEADDWAEPVADPDTHLHLYGKAEAREGRKMGHVTRLLPLGAHRVRMATDSTPAPIYAVAPDR